MPALYDPAQVERLIGTIDHLSDDLDAHKVALIGTDKRSRAARLAAIVGIVVAVIGITVGATGIIYGVKRNDERSAQIIAACSQSNAQRAEIRDAMKLALASLAPPTLTEQQRASLDTYNKSVDLRLPYRDCSPAGIDAYFKSPPKDPAGR